MALSETGRNTLSYIIIQSVRCCYQPWQINGHYPFQSGALLLSEDGRVSRRKLRGTKTLWYWRGHKNRDGSKDVYVLKALWSHNVIRGESREQRAAVRINKDTLKVG